MGWGGTSLCFNYFEKEKKAHFSHPVALCFVKSVTFGSEVIAILGNGSYLFYQYVLKPAPFPSNTHTARIIFFSCCFYKQQYSFHPGVVQPMIFLASVLSSYQGSDTLSSTAERQEGALRAGDVLPSIDTQAVRGKRRRNAWFMNREEWMGLQGLRGALWYTNKRSIIPHGKI